MYGRETLECPEVDEYYGDGDYERITGKYYYKDEADEVMDAMEARIKELESKLNDKDECCKWCKGNVLPHTNNTAGIDGGEVG